MTVVQRPVVGDRVLSHLRLTGHFTGTSQGVPVDGARRGLHSAATFTNRIADFLAQPPQRVGQCVLAKLKLLGGEPEVPMAPHDIKDAREIEGGSS